MPKPYYKSVVKLYPDEELFARETKVENGMISLEDTGIDSFRKLEDMLQKYVSHEKYYFCG